VGQTLQLCPAHAEEYEDVSDMAYDCTREHSKTQNTLFFLTMYGSVFVCESKNQHFE